MLALLLLGFASGLPSQVIDVPLKTWLTQAGIDLKDITSISALVLIPYSFKYLWAPLLDRFTPPFLGRRRGWILLTQIAIIAAIALLAFQTPSSGNLQLVTVIAVAIAFFSASQDIASNAYSADVLEDPETGAGAAVGILGFRISMLFASGVILVLTDPKLPNHISWNTAYLLIAGLMLVNVTTSFWAPKPIEEPKAPDSLAKAIIQPFQEFFQRNGITSGLLILAFIFVYKTGDNMVKGVSTTFLLTSAHYSQTEIGAIGSGVGLISAIVGALVGGILKNKIGTNRSLWLSSILLAIGIVPYIFLAQAAQGLPLNQNPGSLMLLLAMSTELFFASMEATVFVSFLMGLCNKQFTATQYALFSALMIAGKGFVTAPLGSIAESIGWPSFFLLSALSAIPGLLLLNFIAPWNPRES